MQNQKILRRIFKVFFSSSYNHLEQLRKLANECKSKLNKSTFEPRRVLFIHMHGSDYLLTFEGILVNRLRLEGVEPSYLTCSALPLCNNRRYFTVPDYPAICMNCNQHNRDHAEIIGCELKFLGEYERNGIRTLAQHATTELSLEQCLEFVWDGVPLGTLCAVSVSRYLCRDARNIDRPSDLWYFRRFLESGVILVDSLKTALMQLKPNVIIQNSGRFFWYAIADFIARERNIKVVSYEGDGGFGRTWMFREKVPASSLDISELWLAGCAPQLSDIQNQNLDHLLQERRSGSMVKGFVSKSSFSFETNLPRSIESLKGSVIALFSNLTFDSQVSERHTIFKGVIDWLSFTIQNIENSTATYVIRVHPAEAQEHEGEYSRERVIDELRDRGIRIPRNVVIISPAERVNSYALAERAQLSVVYTSTIGLELIIGGNQVVVCGLAHYIDKGFGIIPNTKEEYLSKILDIKEKSIPSSEEIELARSYGYTFWFKGIKQIKAFSTNSRFHVGKLLMDRPSRIVRGADAALDELIDLVLNKSI